MVALLLSSYSLTLSSQRTTYYSSSCSRDNCPDAHTDSGQDTPSQGSQASRDEQQSAGGSGCQTGPHASVCSSSSGVSEQQKHTRRDTSDFVSQEADGSYVRVSSRVAGVCQGGCVKYDGSPGDLLGLLPQPELRRQVGVRWPKKECSVSVRSRC